MKVCDLALFSPETSSGVKTYIASKIEYARQPAGHRARRDRARMRRRVSVLQGRSKVIVVRGTPTFYPGIRIALNIWKIAALVELERPDVIELNCQYTLPWAAFLATRRRRTPIVGIYHTDVPACVGHMARGAGAGVASLARRLTEVYEGLIYRHCTVTVILNPTMREQVGRLGVERVRYLPCGVDAATFSPARRDEGWRARHGIAPGSTALLYVGRLSAEKEVDVALDAYDRLPPGAYHLIVAGDGPDADAIRRYAETRPGVTYVGHIESRSELATAYASSDIFLSPGRYETFGMATLEALACGLPVVGIQGSGTGTFVPPEFGVLAREGDPADFARAIAVVAGWPLDELRSTCHAFAADRYSWDAVLAQYFEVYRRLIDAQADREPVAG